MLKEVLVVEGRADAARIRASHIEADMITTDGFSLRPDTLQKIQCAYEKRGIIILTDPDSAGERIRQYLAALSEGETCLYSSARSDSQS